MPPPAPPRRFNLGVAAPIGASAASPPRTAPLRLPPVGTYLSAANIPGHLNADELKQHMGAYPGCLAHTLKSRPSKAPANPLECQVEFSDSASAEQCRRSLAGRPFLDSHPECGHVLLKVKTITQSDLDKMAPPREIGIPPERVVVTMTPSQQPGHTSTPAVFNRPNAAAGRPVSARLPPPPNIADFDIGERPSAEVRLAGAPI